MFSPVLHTFLYMKMDYFRDMRISGMVSCPKKKKQCINIPLHSVVILFIEVNVFHKCDPIFFHTAPYREKGMSLSLKESETL